MPLDLQIPDLSTACIELSTGPGELCVEFPGGFKVCAQVGYDLGDPSEIVKSMLGQLNSALAPLGPFFNILDVVKAIFDCIMAIPDSLGPPPDPTALLQCIPALQKAVDALLKLLPPFPIFILVKGIIDVIIVGLLGLKQRIRAMIRHLERILQAATAATKLGNLQLQVVIDCASANMDAQMKNMNTEFLPLNRLLGVVNALLQIAGLDCIPMIGGFSEISEAALAPIDAVIELLQLISAAIPAQLPPLPALPPAGEC